MRLARHSHLAERVYPRLYGPLVTCCLGHPSIPSGLPGCCFHSACLQRLAGCGTAACPCCWMLFFRHQSLLPASHGSFSSCHNNHGSPLWAPEPRDQTIFPTPGSLGALCKLSLSPDVQMETKGFWEPYVALALGRDSSLCLS